MATATKSQLRLGVIAAITLIIAAVFPPAAFAQATAPTGWCQGGKPWQLAAAETAIDPGCGAGEIVLTMEGQPNRGYPTMARAEAARGSRAGTYWFEAVAPEPTATPAPSGVGARPTTAPPAAKAGDTVAIVATSDLTADEVSAVMTEPWQQWLSGVSPIVFSNGQGSLNVGTSSALGVELLGNIDLPALRGVIVALEPWRPGCGSTLASGIPQTRGPDCNVGAAFLFSSWSSAIEWLQQENWTEGSLWFRPGESLGGAEPLKTCVAALVPPGTALNIVPGEPVCPDGLATPPWVFEAMVPVAPASSDVGVLREEVRQLREELTYFLCVVESSLAGKDPTGCFAEQ